MLLTLTSPIETTFLRTNKILIGNRSHRALAEHLGYPTASLDLTNYLNRTHASR